jgi:alpha-tubulin suppressor-like RCC1 family protein
LREDGSLWCWGNNSDGQLGDGTTLDQNTPQKIMPEATWRSVGSGDFHTCAIRTDGSLWCWGDNQFGQLGDATTNASAAPGRIGDSDDWLAVALGDYHTCARRLDNSIWCWGSNAYGQLGDGSDTEMRLTPVQTTSESRWIDLTAGNDHTCGLWNDESLWCWGRNSYGQLGDGSDKNRSLPFSVDY